MNGSFFLLFFFFNSFNSLNINFLYYEKKIRKKIVEHNRTLYRSSSQWPRQAEIGVLREISLKEIVFK